MVGIVGHDEPYPVLIVGFGYSGHRFAQAIHHYEHTSPVSLTLGGVCDVAEHARTAAAEVAPAFEDLDAAIKAVRPAAVIVAVNEERHAEVLHRLAPHRLQLVLCEKPLTATLDEAYALPPEITDSVLTVNFVERQSPVLASYFEWAGAQRGLRPRRVEFWWGKHRIADARPTIGVLSELAHPIDLIDYLFGFDRFEVLNAHGISSDFSLHHARSLDTVTLVARADDYVVAGSSSFAWPRRQRLISAILTDVDENVFRATIDFDSPRWDCDHLKLEQLDPLRGRSETLLDVATDNTLFPDELFGIAKVASFLRESFDLARSGTSKHLLVGYAQALKVQRLLQDVETIVSKHSITHSTILAGARPDAGQAIAALEVANGFSATEELPQSYGNDDMF